MCDLTSWAHIWLALDFVLKIGCDSESIRKKAVVTDHQTEAIDVKFISFSLL
jgi:hypothetical protein